MYRVLIVDDEQIVKLAVKSMIDWASGEFQLAGTASDGEAALQVLERSPVDILITDLKMPRMDGLELIRAVQGSATPPAVLVLSNHADFELVREALRLGARDYLLKTDISAEVLTESLRTLVGARPPRAPETTAFLINLEAIDELERAGAEALQEPGTRLGILVTRPSESLDLAASLIEQGLKACRRCLTGRTASGAGVLVLVVAPGTEARSEAMADWLVDQARLFYGTELSLVVSPLITDALRFKTVVAEAEKAAELFFYRAWRGRALPVAGGILPGAPAWPAVGDSLEDVQTLTAWGSVGRVSPVVLKDEVEALVARLAGLAGSEAPSVASIRDCGSEEALVGLFSHHQGRAYRSEVQRVVDHIQAHPTERIAVHELAALVRMNETYLCTVFKAQTGKSIVQYINDAKLDRAKALLVTGRFLVKEVAAAVGIDDPFYFNRLFHRRFGDAPSRFLP